MRIDLIALDLDGTLLGPDERVSARDAGAIRQALAAGVRVVLVTGRGVDLPVRISHELGLSLPVICCHGALIKDFAANKTLLHVPVPPAYAVPMARFAVERRLAIAIYAQEYFWRLEGGPILMADMNGPAWRAVESFEALLEYPPTFMRFMGRAAVDAVLAEFGDWPLNFRYETWYDFAEIAVLDREASKRNALVRLCADFQIPRDRVLAIGDSRNDIPMLRWAGIGVAMGNALPEVKESVRFITASNAHDGVARAIERFVERPQKRPA